MPGDSSADAVVGDGLKVSVGDAHRQIGADLNTEVIFPGEIDLRAEVNRRHTGIFGSGSAKPVEAFVLAGNDRLQRERVLLAQHDEEAWTTCPGQVIGEPITKVTATADGILHVGGEETSVPARE